MTLYGPEHPEHFRQQIGRYGDRHYVDNLPADDIVGEDKDPYPSVSVIKGAYPKFLNDWVAKEVAGYAVDTKQAWANLDRDGAIELISGAARRVRDRSAKRGSDVHDIIERLAQKRPIDIRLATDDVRPYIPAIQQMVSDMRLKPEVLEAVIFNRHLGYGGTFDFIGGTVNGRALLDWKTRKKFNPYDEEAGQVAAYAGGQYMIIEENGRPRRMKMPEVDYLGVVILTPDGYQVHEVDFQRAFKMWEALTDFWYAKADRGFFRGVLPIATTRSDPVALHESLRERVIALNPAARQELAILWPPNVPTLKQHPSPMDLVIIENLVEQIEKKHRAGFQPPAQIEEGDTLDLETTNAMFKALGELPQHVLDAIIYYVERSEPPIALKPFVAATPWRNQENTVRKFEIYRALIVLASAADGDTGRMSEMADMHNLPLWTIEHSHTLIADYEGVRS